MPDEGRIEPHFMDSADESDVAIQPWNEEDRKLLIHSDDAAALRALDAIPGFKQLVNGVASATAEQMFRGEALGNNIKLDFDQMGEYYKLLSPICEKFALARVPDLFLEMSPVPNAYTFGASRPFIVISSGLLEQLTVDEVQLVLAHECGHILCRHPLYTMMAMIIGYGVAWIPFKLNQALQIPIYAWKRASEFSADRAMLAFAGNPEKAMKVIIRLSGGGFKITNKINLEAYKNQVKEYYNLSQDPSAQSAMQTLLRIYSSHPFASARSYEFMKWSQSPQFSFLSKKIGTYDPRCPICGAPMKQNTKICINGHFS